ncbi:MAG: rhomboid family intramembrane serine protease [Alphaproteobacteria bacterium]|nr:MAG: rhomboid family intramembrane serine protease [Alphaproteobacteria bacterium]
MFPIRDHNPSRRTPLVTWALIAANILVFLSYWPLFSDERALAAFFNDWALVPAALFYGEGETYRIFTSMFMHGGLMHLAGNMLFLWIFGDNLEDVLGHVGFLLFYLASGVAAALSQALIDPTSTIPMVGASGAIAGVMGGYLLLFPRARVDVLIIFVVFVQVIPLPAWMMLGFWFGMQVLSGTLAPPDMGGVAYWAHAGGFIAGAVLVLPAWLRRGARHYWVQTHGHPPHPATHAPTTVPIVRRRRR